MAADAPAKTRLTAREQLIVARILKVNHAGEHGAIRIYRGQIFLARWLHHELVQPLSGMLAHEIAHRSAFRDAMPSRQARPCRAMWLWGVGGSMLGLATALIGRQAIWITTAAVEAAVHRHLDDQLEFLDGRDLALHQIIADIREEELSHLRTAEAHITGNSRFGVALASVISWATDALIWLSTSGDSARMVRDLANQRPASQDRNR